MAVRTAYDPTAGEVLTAANLERLPGGWIGYAETVSNQGGITTVVDLTSLSVAVTVAPSRRVRISAHINANSTVGTDVIKLSIKESTTVLQEITLTPASTNYNGINGSVVLTPSSGAHTYKLTLERAAGTGSVSLGASTTQPSSILVEDIGPSS